jgi:serine/threonine protein kinase
VVYRARQLATKRTVALKVSLQGAFATEKQRHRFEREVELVASLRHPNIVTVFDSGVDEEGRHFGARTQSPSSQPRASHRFSPTNTAKASYA